MPQSSMITENLNKIYQIEIGDINISQHNVRGVTEATKDLDELAASIKRHGLLQPVVLSGNYGEPPYDLISGQRRFLAHKQILKQKYINSIFAGKLTKTDAIVRSLVENVQRLELDYNDTSEAVTYLFEKYNKDEHKVAKETGLSLQKVREFIMIKALATDKIKEYLKAKKISPIDVKRAIRAAQDNLKKAEELIELIIERKPDAHQKRRIGLYGQTNKNASAKTIIDEAMKPHVEQNIIVTLPSQVRASLTKATEKMVMEPDELMTKILTDWLRTQGYLD